MNRTILIVDDETMITKTLTMLISMTLHYTVKAFNDPLEALQDEDLLKQKVDLIISDFLMPGMNGIEFLKCAKAKSPDTITILLTGYADKGNAIKSINEVGLYYYLEKPWDNHTLIKVIQNGLEKKELTEDLNIKYRELEESHQENLRLYELLKVDYLQEVDNVKNLIISLANVIEAKDKYTDGHTRRVGSICKALGQKVGMTHEAVQYLEIAGIIHDIGKVGVPEAILNKPGKLDDEEFEQMKKHSVIGENICKPLNSLQKCLDPIRHHHEKLNGTGYPDGQQGSEVSQESRILAVADIFDALYSKRPYRDKLPLNKVKAIMLEETDKGCLDRHIVYLMFELLDNGNLVNIIDQ